VRWAVHVGWGAGWSSLTLLPTLFPSSGDANALSLALCALEATPASRLTDSGVWVELCGALQRSLSLAHQQDTHARTLRLVRRLIAATVDDAAGVQLAQLCRLLALACCAGGDVPRRAALVDDMLLAQRALQQHWRVRAPGRGAPRSGCSHSPAQGLRREELAELAASYCQLLRSPGALEALSEGSGRAAGAHGLLGAWCGNARACAALANALSADSAAALAALVECALASPPHGASPFAIALLGQLLRSSAVRRAFPVGLLSLAELLDAFSRAAAEGDDTRSDAALHALVNLAESDGVHACWGPLLQRLCCTQCCTQRSAPLLRALSGTQGGMHVLCDGACGALEAVADNLASSHAGDALLRHSALLERACRDEHALSVLLQRRVLDWLCGSHAHTPSRHTRAALAAFAWLPAGVQALCEQPGAADAAADGLTECVRIELVAASSAPCSGRWRDARYAASALSAHPRGAAALRDARWHEALGGQSPGGLVEGDSAALTHACARIEALLWAKEPALMVRLLRDGTSPASLVAHSAALHRAAMRSADEAFATLTLSLRRD